MVWTGLSIERDIVVRMAQQAGFYCAPQHDWLINNFEKFAMLIQEETLRRMPLPGPVAARDPVPETVSYIELVTK